jgi:carbamoyl-phosphate synthase large subunit
VTTLEEGYEVVVLNSNPATIQTEPGVAHGVYIEPLTVESVRRVIERDQDT